MSKNSKIAKRYQLARELSEKRKARKEKERENKSLANPKEQA